MGYPSDDDLESQVEEVESETGFECFIIVDNIPVVPREKYEKLSAVLVRVLVVVMSLVYKKRSG